MTNSSFVNGLIAGAGIVLALMSFGFLQYIAPVENQQGISSTEIRVAIMLGGIVTAVAIGYEFYSKKEEKKQNKSKSNEPKDINEIKTEPVTADEIKIESDKSK